MSEKHITCLFAINHSYDGFEYERLEGLFEYVDDAIIAASVQVESHKQFTGYDHEFSFIIRSLPVIGSKSTSPSTNAASEGFAADLGAW